jgi:hypothetical protein
MTETMQHASAPAQVSFPAGSALSIIQTEIPAYRGHQDPRGYAWVPYKVGLDVDSNLCRIRITATVRLTSKASIGWKLPRPFTLPCMLSLSHLVGHQSDHAARLQMHGLSANCSAHNSNGCEEPTAQHTALRVAAIAETGCARTGAPLTPCEC